MNAFRREHDKGRSGGGRQYSRAAFKSRNQGSGSGGYGHRDAGPQLFEAICADCGKKTEVPFKPNGRKPVYCRDCFQQEDRAPRESFGRSSFSKPQFTAQRPLEAGPQRNDRVEKRLDEMDAKLDRIIREIEALKEKNA
jgi:CxxC-x17-CxxC domain-containing protein